MPTSKTTKTTIDHAAIQRWAKQRDATPSVVKGVEGPGPGILRLDLPGYSGQDSLTPIPWREWLQKFDESELAFVYQDQTASGVPSNFNKLVARDTVNLHSDDSESEPPRSRSVSRARKSAPPSRKQTTTTPRGPAPAGSAARSKKKTTARRSTAHKPAKTRV